MRVALGLEYAGAAFCGFQSQPSGCGVQDALESALGEIAGQYLKKGRPVYIEGKIQTRKWQDKEGKDRYTTEIIADEMKMLGGRDGGDSGGSSYGGGGSNEYSSAPPAPRAAAPQASRPQQAARPVDEFEDDIPF